MIDCVDVVVVAIAVIVVRLHDTFVIIPLCYWLCWIGLLLVYIYSGVHPQACVGSDFGSWHCPVYYPVTSHLLVLVPEALQSTDWKKVAWRCFTSRCTIGITFMSLYSHVSLHLWPNCIYHLV